MNVWIEYENEKKRLLAQMEKEGKSLAWYMSEMDKVIERLGV